MKKLPVGTQAFDKLRKDGAVYVDKTEHVYNLINNGSVYFLSRPRRFGKSLLISTFKELFKGSKELFEGLYIYDKWDWSKKYPVIHLDFAKLAYDTPGRLENSLSDFIGNTALEYSITLTNSEIETRFSELIEKLHQSTGQQVVVLIDEYDKPLIDSLNDEEIYKKIKKILHSFYQVIKAGDAHIKFVFLTGVSQFSGLSIFSGLNNLENITMSEEFSSICGYTQEELENNFKEHIQEAAKANRMTEKEILSEIKYYYNGYSWDGKTSVYNPFSTLLFLKQKKFNRYWFETGTPTFLIEQIRKRDELVIFTQPQKVNAKLLRGGDDSRVSIEALLFQTGYMTIKAEERIERDYWYTIDFPNYEVRTAILEDILEIYVNKDVNIVKQIGYEVFKAVINKEEIELREKLRELFANISYNLSEKTERYYHSLFIMVCKMSGFEVESEVHTNKGRIDVVLKKGNTVVIVEIKYSKDNKIEEKLKEAMLQIRDKKYYEKYINNTPTLLAIVFSENKEIGCKFENL
jgi:Holliday junction resolvase-like predicted endonuclease